MSAAPEMTLPRLELRGVTKRFPGVLANDRVSLSVMPGEVHALLGENGAGKSTLVKIIYGVLEPDSGDILWEGAAATVSGPAAARDRGIGMVFQHFNLFETLTVAENVSLGLDDRRDRRRLARDVRAIGDRYGLAVEPDRPVHALSVGERQRVEIIRCLMQDPSLLILDEPTSVLTPQEAEALFHTLEQIAGEGRSVLYISHKLHEVQRICDRATVLRHGRVVDSCAPKRETPRSLARMMLGGDLPSFERPERPPAGTERLVIDDLTVRSPRLHGVDLDALSFSVGSGEILGIAGVAGNGQAELIAVLNGEIRTPRAGMVRMDGVPVGTMSPAQRRRRGLGVVPEERLGRGAVAEMSLVDNILLTARRGRGVVRGLIRRDQAAADAARILDAFDVRAGGSTAEAKSLSGGNLQKFIVGREIILEPSVLVLAHPTWGIDVGAAVTIHRAIADVAAAGGGVVVISEDLDELLSLCDRIAVIAGGRLSPVVPTSATTAEEIGLWMAGQFPPREAAETARAH